jgi:hypothetical protein
MALLVDDRPTIEPCGALAFACLLYLAGRHEAAQFWWQFAAGADSSTAALSSDRSAYGVVASQNWSPMRRR